MSILINFQSYAFTELSDEGEVQKLFETSTLPDFTPYLKKAIPGRCFFKNPKEKQTASVLLPIPNANDFEIAPLAAEKRDSDFFDKLSYDFILKQFPQVQKLKRKVTFTEEEIVLFRNKGGRQYEGKIRELNDYFFVKVVLNNLDVRYCYYGK